MLFTGSYEHRIDEKHRLAIPADIRARWRTEEDGTGWYAAPWQERLIRLYTERDFQNRALKQAQALSLTPGGDEAELQASFFGLSARVEMDSAGRIRLPEQMLMDVGLGQEVTLVGAGDRLEIRDRAEWREGRLDRMRKMPEMARKIGANRASGSGE